MQVVVTTLMALAFAAVSALGPDVAGRDVGGVLAPHGKLLLSFSVKRHINRRTVKDIGARQVYDTNAAPIIARGDKETVTVTVTADCTAGAAETPVVTGASVPTGPVVIVPGTQSETGTYSIPAGGATITPGVSGNVPVPSTAEASAAASSPELPSPGNVTSSPVAAPVSSAPVTSTTGTTTAVSTKSSTSSESTTVESTSTEAASESTVPTPSSPTNPAATGAAVNNFAGVYMLLAVALVGSVALLI